MKSPSPAPSSMALESRHWKHHTTESGWFHCKLVCNPCQQWSRTMNGLHMPTNPPSGQGAQEDGSSKPGQLHSPWATQKKPKHVYTSFSPWIVPTKHWGEVNKLKWGGTEGTCAPPWLCIWIEQRWPLHSLDWNPRKCLTLSISWEKKGTVNKYLERLEEWSLWVLPTKTLAATTIPKLNIFLVDGWIDGFKQQQVWQQQ